MSFGSAMGAIVSLKNNRRPRKARVETFVKTTGSGIRKIEDYKKISAEERAILRQRILREQRKGTFYHHDYYDASGIPLLLFYVLKEKFLQHLINAASRPSPFH